MSRDSGQLCPETTYCRGHSSDLPSEQLASREVHPQTPMKGYVATRTLGRTSSMAIAGKKRVQKMAMSVAAVGVATSIVGVAATAPALISSSLVDLAALIVVGSSTHPDGSGTENFFRGQVPRRDIHRRHGDDIVHVNFFTGPAGIYQALQANAGEPNAVIASGWGAANASLLLRQMDAQNDPILGQTLFVLDNDVAMPDGGFGTRYPWFALIGVNPLPTPSVSRRRGGCRNRIRVRLQLERSRRRVESPGRRQLTRRHICIGT